MAKVRVLVGLQHTNVVDLGHVEGEKNLIDHEIINYTNHTIILALNSMLRHILVIQTIIVRPEGGQVPGLNRPLTH